MFTWRRLFSFHKTGYKWLPFRLSNPLFSMPASSPEDSYSLHHLSKPIIFEKVKTNMGSAQPLALTPALTLINRQTSTRFRHIKDLHCFTPKTWSRNADTSFDCRFPFLSYSISPPLHPSFPLCSRFPLPRPPLPSLFPLGFHPLRSFLMSSMATPQAAASDSSQPSETKTVRVVIKGRVQGVFYRNWTIENATQLGLKGWVRNRRDGSVEALFSGTPDSVEEMEQRCRRGPPAAMVTGLQVFPSDDDPGTGFQRKQTV